MALNFHDVVMRSRSGNVGSTTLAVGENEYLRVHDLFFLYSANATVGNRSPELLIFGWDFSKDPAGLSTMKRVIVPITITASQNVYVTSSQDDQAAVTTVVAAATFVKWPWPRGGIWLPPLSQLSVIDAAGVSSTDQIVELALVAEQYLKT